MDVIVNNSEELFQFANGLSALSNDLVNSFNAANRQMDTALVGWKDHQSLEFQNQFREATKVIYQISEMMTNFSGYVRRYAEFVSNVPKM